MRGYQYLYACVIVAVVLALGACPSAVSRGESGVVSVHLGSQASRGVLDAPPFPVFSSANVTVTGPGMSPVTASLVNGAASITVPGGTDRLVTVDAVPDWTATAAANPGKSLTTLAKRYGGTATLDVESGRSVSVSIQLRITESRIFLPDVATGKLYTADSFAALSSIVQSPVTDGGYFTWDGYGRIYYVRSAVIERYVDLTSASPDVTIDGIPFEPNVIALDNLKGRLYYLPTEGALSGYDGPGFFDGATQELVRLNPPPSVNLEMTDDSRLAVDDDGVIYITAVDPDNSSLWYIIKASVGDPHGSSPEIFADPTIIKIISFQDAGLTYDSGTSLFATDMVVIGDTLYIAAIDYVGAARSRGKVVALSTDFSKVQTVGWCGDDQYYPVPGKEGEQFYGSVAFLGFAPNRLYVEDGGVTAASVSVSRVVELSLSPLAITATAATPAGISFIDP